MRNYDFDINTLSLDEMLTIDAGSNDFTSGGQDDTTGGSSSDPGFTTMWSLDV